jgi:cystathionine beta-synthase
MVHQNVLSTIGNTPIIQLNNCVPKGPHKFWGKVEYMNPGGSVKDRIALSIIEAAEKRGELKPGGTIIEATSGNTGVGLAMVAAVKGYKTVFVMPEKISEEKRATLRAYGARVVITPTGVEPEDPRSHYMVAKRLTELIPGGFCANQYHNPDNPTQHYETTGPEIWEQTEGKVDVFVGGIGTGGTLSGVGRYLKEKKPEVKIVCSDPIGSILHDLFYYKEVRTPPAPYKVEGIGEDMLPDNVHFKYMDDFVQVDDKMAFDLCREVVAKEGLLLGPSSASALAAAFIYAKKLTKPSNFVILLPDHGSKYLSKAFNDTWLMENALLDDPSKIKKVSDLVKAGKFQKTFPAVDISDSIDKVISKLSETNQTELPVLFDKKVFGWIDQKLILWALNNGRIRRQESVSLMVDATLKPVSEDQPLAELDNAFQSRSQALVSLKSGENVLVRHIDYLEFMATCY